MLPVLLVLALQAGLAPSGEGSPSPTPQGEGPVVVFLVDNSASLPPLDPGEKRRVALQKMLGFVEGSRQRLILFGRRSELSMDDTERYRNDGQWTDFYHAFRKTDGIVASYPAGTDVRIVLLTDAIVDPDPADWPDLPPGEDLATHNIQRTVELLRKLGTPLYVILVGDPTNENVADADREQSPGFVLEMVRAANGAAAAPLAQTLASFFSDDGTLLRKFVYRIRPDEGLEKIEPTVRRIAAPPRPEIEMRIFGYFILPLVLLLLALVGLLVHTFPGPGDLEIPRARPGPAGARCGRQAAPNAGRLVGGAGAEPGEGSAGGRGHVHASRRRGRAHRRRPGHDGSRPGGCRAPAPGARRGSYGDRSSDRLGHA